MSDHDKFVRDEVAKAINTEKKRNQLLDKSIGGSGMPRPSDDYINSNLGKKQTPAEIEQSAHNKAWEKDRANERAREMLPDLERKMEGRRDRNVETGRDRLKSDERGSMRDNLRNNRNGRDGIER